MKPDFAQYGFRYQDNLIQAFVGGSQLHGAKLEASDDTDYYGVYLEPVEKVVMDPDEHFVFSTGGKAGGNMPHDIDVCLYSLRKWARLAMKGNPSVLHFLFAEPMFNTIPWARVFYQRDIFLAKSHIGQFLGYANAQLAKLLGQRGGKDCRRRALEEKHSYDTKYAMHLIRLYGEALELFTDGKITFPRPEKDFLIGIRAGAYTLSQIRELANDLESQVHAAKDKSPLPDTIDRVKVSNFISNIYMNFWEDGIPVGSWHYEEKTR